MKFKDLLNEKFSKGVNLSPEGYIEIFEDPTTKEMSEVARNSYYSEIRFGVLDKPNGKIYAWDSAVIHAKMMKFLKIDFGFQHRPINDTIESTHHVFWKKFKNKKSFLKKLKKLIPRAKKLSVWSPEGTSEYEL